MGANLKSNLTRIDLGIGPASINNFELGVEYSVAHEWLEAIHSTGTEDHVCVPTSQGDIAFTLKIKNLPNRQTVTLTDLKTWRVDRVQFQNVALTDWEEDSLIHNFENIILSKGCWNEDSFIIADMILWFKGQRVEELLVYSELQESRGIVDNVLVNQILSSTNLCRIV